MNKIFFRNLLFSSFFVVLTGTLIAATDMIHFQGRLTDNQGRPISPGQDVRVQFSIYSAMTGGALLWPGSGEQSVATNDAGLFSTDFGPVPSRVFAQNSDLYLEVAVRETAGFKTLSPRQKISAVPYSYFATFASSAGYAANIPDGSITPQKIQPGAVTSDALAQNSVGSPNIIDGGVQAVDLATGAVKTWHLSDNSVTANKVDENSFLDAGLSVPPGAIFMFLSACPSGYSEVIALRHRIPMGADTGSEDDDVPNSPNQTFGSKTHSHSIVHTHETGIQDTPAEFEEIGTPQDYVYFTRPKLIGGIAALATQDYVAVKGYDHTHSTVSQSTSTSGLTTVLPPALTVLFCQKQGGH